MNLPGTTEGKSSENTTIGDLGKTCKFGKSSPDDLFFQAQWALPISQAINVVLDLAI